MDISPNRPQLGVVVMGLTPELRAHFGASGDRGVLVAHVEPGTRAASAGIEVGDVITGVRGRTVETAQDVMAALATVTAGDVVTVELVRDKKPLSVQCTGALPNWLRMLVEPFTVQPSPTSKTTLFDAVPMPRQSLHFS